MKCRARLDRELRRWVVEAKGDGVDVEHVCKTRGEALRLAAVWAATWAAV